MYCYNRAAGAGVFSPATLGSVALTAVNRGELARLLAFKEPEKDNEEDN